MKNRFRNALGLELLRVEALRDGKILIRCPLAKGGTCR